MHPISWLKGLGLGALGMYFFDPRSGSRRQAEAVDQVAQLANDCIKSLDQVSRDISDRLSGAWHEVLGSLDTQSAAAQDELSEQSFSEERLSEERATSAAGDEGEMADFQGRDAGEREIPIFAGSPGMRLAAGAIGTLLMANCAIRRRPMSILMGTVGFAMMVQALSSDEAPAQAGGTRRQRSGKRRKKAAGAEAPHEPNAAAEESMQGSEGSAIAAETPAENTAGGEEVQISYSADLEDEISPETAAAERPSKRTKTAELERAELGEV